MYKFTLYKITSYLNKEQLAYYKLLSENISQYFSFLYIVLLMYNILHINGMLFRNFHTFVFVQFLIISEVFAIGNREWQVEYVT